MNTIATHTFRLLLFTLLPLASHAAPTPYWPGYPPSPYYYPPPPPVNPSARAPVATAVTTAPEMPPAVEENSQQQMSAPIDTAPQSVAETAPPATDIIEEAVTITVHADPKDADDNEAVINEELTSRDTRETAEALAQEIAAAIQQGNFAEAYYLWRPLAEAGNAEAQYGIGWMYHNGYGLAIDDDEAIAWWELASLQGHVDATFALGMLYSLGEGQVHRDMTQAIRYYRLAALGGHEDARLLLRTLMIEENEDARQLMQTLLAEGREEEISSLATVTSKKANVRRGPGTQHKVLTTLQQGHKLLPLKRKGRWLLLGIEGKPYTGWIHDSLVGKEHLPLP